MGKQKMCSFCGEEEACYNSTLCVYCQLEAEDTGKLDSNSHEPTQRELDLDFAGVTDDDINQFDAEGE